MANRLTDESSPYLRQHARNPVDWYPWGEEALERAAGEKKILIISIGYSSCHWCHVMEQETFEDPEVAGLMNESFVSIKVDREERPDIDAHYMNALQLMKGQGGWPLNIFALPDGRAFYGGTYFPRDHWMHLLTAVRDRYKADRPSLEETAGKVEEGIRDFKLRMLEPDSAALDSADLDRAVNESRRIFDLREGGRAGAPKFPNPVWLRFLMAWSHLRDDRDSRDFVLLTLDKMAAGGLYDQIGGGFARYSVDSFWKVPHFEKMLYDNAQLISLYADAYKMTGNGRYARIVGQSMAFIAGSMRSPEGPFYSALDADSGGEEGRYYVWTEAELKDLLGEDYGFAVRYYRIGGEGLWEGGRNILLLPEPPIEDSEEGRRLEKIRLKLKERRSGRTAPGLDDKALVSWNALMIRACTDAYDALGREEYLHMGKKAAGFILQNFGNDDGSLCRAYREGTAYLDGFFEDYAHLSGALISLFESSGDPFYLKEAHRLTEKSIELFYDEEQKIFYNIPEAEGSIQREAELSDGILPSPNAAAAHNLFRLSKLTGNERYKALSGGLQNRMSGMIRKNILYFSHWAELALYGVEPFFETVVVGEGAEELSAELRASYIPNTVHAFSIRENDDEGLFSGRYAPDKTQIYICRDNSCGLPLEEAEDALARLAP